MFLVVEPSKIIFLIQNTIPKRGYNLTLYWVPEYPQMKYYSAEICGLHPLLGHLKATRAPESQLRICGDSLVLPGWGGSTVGEGRYSNFHVGWHLNPSGIYTRPAQYTCLTGMTEWVGLHHISPGPRVSSAV